MSNKIKLGLFLACVAISLIWSIIFSQRYSINYTYESLNNGDGSQYIESLDRLLDTGTLSFFKSNDHGSFASTFFQNEPYSKEVYYAFRTPSFLFIYLPIRLFFDKENAVLLFLIFQLLVFSLAKLLASLYSQRIFPGKYTFLFSFLFLNLNPFLHYYLSFVLTESMATSFLFLSIYLFYTRNTIGFNLLTGFLFTQSIWMRPFLLPVALLFVLPPIWKERRLLLTQQCLIIFIPFTLLFGGWVLRNYFATQQFIPIAATMYWEKYENKVYTAERYMARTTGTNAFWWDAGTYSYWLEHPEDSTSIKEILEKQMDGMDLSKLNFEKLILAKNCYWQSKDSLLPLINRQENEVKASELIRSFVDDYQMAYPKDAKIGSHLRRIGHFCFLDVNFKFGISLSYPFNVLGIAVEGFIYALLFLLSLVVPLLYFLFFRKRIQIQKVEPVIAFGGISIFVMALFVGVFRSIEIREYYISMFFMSVLSGVFLPIAFRFPWWLKIGLCGFAFAISIYQITHLIKF